MQKWEYLCFQYSDILQRIDWQNRTDNARIEPANIVEQLNNAGGKGWELVSVIPIAWGWGDTRGVNYYFKRIIEE